MPKAPTITYADVERLAGQMTASGIEPTIAKIIQAHGSGSASTVTPLLRQWRDNQPKTAPASGTLTDKIRTVIESEIQRLTTEATAAVRGELATANETISALVTEAEGKQLSIDTLEKALAEMTEQFVQARGAKETLSKELTEQRAATLDAEKRLAFMEGSEKSMRDQLDEMKKNAEALRNAIAAQPSTPQK